MKTFGLALGCLLLLNSCSSSKLSLTDALSLLSGKWSLQSLAGQSSLSDLFANQLPALQFDTQAMRVSGNNGCNNLSGPLRLEAGNKISFGQLASTRKACPGQGESVFTNALNKVTNFTVDKGIMKLLAGEEEVMRFVKDNS